VLETTLKALQAAIVETGAHVTADELPTVRGDETQIAHLLQNLISNSIKYRSQEAPRIHIGAKRQDGMWLLSVRDNGIGFAPEYAKHIFEAFRRLDRSSSTSGTGVGLAIAKRVVENHGGHIWAESEPGIGSTFYFTLSDKPLGMATARSAD
jgi:signal transduction histidine kinase